MAVTRGPIPADRFTIIDNDWLRDPRITWKAKGLLAYIASHAVGHVLRTEQIIAEGADSRDAIRSGLRELEEAGYLTRVQQRGEGGKITSTDYHLGTPGDGKPVAGSDQGEHGVSAGGTSDGKPGAGEPAGKKTTQEKTREKTTSSASPRRGTRLPEDFMPDAEMRAWYSERIGSAVNGLIEHEKFMNFWLAKSGKDATKVDWRRTWMNWMLTALDRAPRRPVSGAPAGAPQPPRYPSAAERAHQQSEREHQEAQAAEEWLEANGGDPNDNAQLRAVLARIRSGELGSAPRTPMPYIDGEVVGENGAAREVTSYATDRGTDPAR
jgi:hypothetical protein